MNKVKRIGILTGGGDCPGINAVIRAVAKKAILQYGWEVIGIEDGYDGLIRDRHRKLSSNDISGILAVGGTILGASKISNPYRYAIEEGSAVVFKDVSKQAIKNFSKLEIDALVCIGGDGTLGIAHKLFRDGVPLVGVPKTIDNDLKGTDITFGFDSAVAIATEAIDRIHTTAQSHHRIMIIEVMGNRAGWIALYAGVAAKVRDRRKRGKRFSIVVISEGAKPKGGEVMVKRIVEKCADPMRLGGVGFILGEGLERISGIETRTVVLGHLQRGGPPTATDRILATRLGAEAVEMIVRGELGRMTAVQNGRVTTASLEEAASGPRLVPLDHPLIAAARALGTSFGDE